MTITEITALFFQGLALGFSIAAPVGPIGLLCIQRSLSKGFRSGLASGLGAASADALYGTIAALGLTLAADFLTRGQVWLRLAGGLFLLYLAVQTFRSKPAEEAAHTADSGKGTSYLRDYASTLLLTLSNPITIFSFLAIFGGMGASAASDAPWSPFVLVAGVFSGSAAWWLLLSGGVSLFRGKINETVLRWVNRLAGAVIAVFAVVMLWGALRP